MSREHAIDIMEQAISDTHDVDTKDRHLAAAAYDALQAAGMVSEWRPIETAPKDDQGSQVLLWIDGDAAVGYWLEDEWVPNDATVACTAFIVQPTHWMPLPEPPAAQEETEK